MIYLAVAVDIRQHCLLLYDQPVSRIVIGHNRDTCSAAEPHLRPVDIASRTDMTWYW